MKYFRLRRLVAWLPFVVIGLVIGAGESWERYRNSTEARLYSYRLAKYDAACEELNSLLEQKFFEIVRSTIPLEISRMPNRDQTAELLQSFGKLSAKPIPVKYRDVTIHEWGIRFDDTSTSQPSGVEFFTLTQFGTGARAMAEFRDGRWLGGAPDFGGRASIPLPNQSQAFTSISPVSRLAAEILAGALLFGWVAAPKHRKLVLCRGFVGMSAICVLSTLPYWVNWNDPAWRGEITPVMLLAAVSAIMLAVTARLVRAKDPRRCALCGYDLRGNLSGTCPECGNPISQEQQVYLSSLNG